MNREIKFRTPHFNYDGSFSHFNYWGAIDHHQNTVLDHSCFMSPGTTNSTTKGWHEQYTGLKDRNGKEIFEGDVLNVSNMEFSHFEDSGVPDSPNEIFIDIKGEVSFSRGQFEVGGHSLGEIPLSAMEAIDIEIIGNIYETPELLKQ